MFLCLHDVRQGMCSLLILAWLGSADHCSDNQRVHIIEIHPILTILRVHLHIHLGRGGHSGGAGGAQATPGILIFQKQVTPFHQIR